MFEDTTLDSIYLALPFVWLDLFRRLPLQLTRIEKFRQTVAAVPLEWFTKGLQLDGLKAIRKFKPVPFRCSLIISEG